MTSRCPASSKDCDGRSEDNLGFVKDRVPFVHAIAAISGLELKVGRRRILDQSIRGRVKALQEAYEAASIPATKYFWKGRGQARALWYPSALIGDLLMIGRRLGGRL